MALALPREVIEIEVPDNSNLDNTAVDPVDASSKRSTLPHKKMCANIWFDI